MDQLNRPQLKIVNIRLLSSLVVTVFVGFVDVFLDYNRVKSHLWNERLATMC